MSCLSLGFSSPLKTCNNLEQKIKILRCNKRGSFLKFNSFQGVGVGRSRGCVCCQAGIKSVEVVQQNYPKTIKQFSLKQLQELNDRDVETPLPSAEDLAQGLNTSLQHGISTNSRQIQWRRDKYGTNKLPEPDQITFWELILNTFKDITVILLLFCGLGELGLGLTIESSEGSWLEGAAILFTVFLVVTVTATVEFQKEKQFQALNALNRDTLVRVIRSGEQISISLFEVLVGDLIVVEAGDIIPADCFLVQADDIKVDESHMTGESDDIEKNAEEFPILLSGSKILAGGGKAIITAVGPNSQQGIIQSLLLSKNKQITEQQPTATATPEMQETLQQETVLVRQLGILAENIGIAGFGAAILTMFLVAGLFTYDTFFVQQLSWDWSFLHKYVEAVTTGITVFVVAVPEGLPLAVTLALAFSVNRMLQTNNLVRHLDACETMGCATTICTDKTGTLTENNLEVVHMWVAGRLIRNPNMKFQNKQNVQKNAQNLQKGKTFKNYRLKNFFDFDFQKQNSSDLTANASGENLSLNLNSQDSNLVQQKLPSEDMDNFSIEQKTQENQKSPAENSNNFEQKTQRNFKFFNQQPNLSLNFSGDLNSKYSLNLQSKKSGISGINNTVWEVLKQSLAMNSTATAKIQDGEWKLQGNRTEGAMLKLAINMGGDIEKIRKEQQIIKTLTFSSQRKRMSALCKQCDENQNQNGNNKFILYSKGAIEIMLDKCSYFLDENGQQQSLTNQLRDELLQGFGEKDLRILCTCFREIDCSVDLNVLDENELEKDFTLISMLGMRDTIRPEVPAAIQGCKRAGIDVKMLTGDNIITATAIAKQVGILENISEPVHVLEDTEAQNGHETFHDELQISGDHLDQEGLLVFSSHEDLPLEEKKPLVIEGKYFRKLVMNQDGSINKEMFRKVWRSLKVLARCSPTDKYVMVTGCKALKEDEEEVVAMTGDGTNDAPALRMADVGFAMNSGTSIAKEASDILIMDDNFNSIVQAVKWGRNVYAGIIKFLQFQLTINGVAVTTACVGAAAFQSSPLTAVQMLWVNLIMDSLASLALATEKPSDNMLDLPPFRASAPLINNIIIKNMIGQGIYQIFIMYLMVFQGDELLGVNKEVQLTMVFNVFVQMQLFNQINCRKIFGEESVFDKFFDNQWFVGILAGEAFLQFLIVQYGGDAFKTVPLDLKLWTISIGFGALSLIVRQILLRIPPYDRKFLNE